MFTGFVRAPERVKPHTGIEIWPRHIVSSAEFWAMNESLTQLGYVKEDGKFYCKFLRFLIMLDKE